MVQKVHAAPFVHRPSSRMASLRRIKIFTVLLFLAVVTLLFYTASYRQSRAPDTRTAGDFYDRTVSALNAQSARSREEDEVVSRKLKQSIKEAERLAKDNANARSPNKPDPPSQLVGVGSAANGARGDERSVAGRKKFGAGEEQKVAKEVEEETEEDHQVEVELNSILKKSPIIIFSKSYCPHSRRAKDILLEKYIIDPAPYVVELDLHPIGAGLQARLAKLTGRRTVPNVLINAVSIGGGDDVAGLDDREELIDKIKKLAGKKMRDVRVRPVEESHDLR